MGQDLLTKSTDSINIPIDTTRIDTNQHSSSVNEKT